MNNYAFRFLEDVEEPFIQLVAVGREVRHFSRYHLTRLRLDRAVDMLTAGDRSIREAGEESGFSGENYFSNVFKRHYIFSATSTKNSLLLLENFAIPPYFSETAEMEARPMPFRLWPVE